MESTGRRTWSRGKILAEKDKAREEALKDIEETLDEKKVLNI